MNTTTEYIPSGVRTRSDADPGWRGFLADDPVMQIPPRDRNVGLTIYAMLIDSIAVNEAQRFAPGGYFQDTLLAVAKRHGFAPEDRMTPGLRHLLADRLHALTTAVLGDDMFGLKSMTPEERSEWLRADSRRRVEQRKRDRARAEHPAGGGL